MYGILMTVVLAGTSSVPGNPMRALDEINGVFGGYGSYGGFGGSGCGYSGYASYSRYTGCGPGPGYVYFVDNGCCNYPRPVFVPAPCPTWGQSPCFSPWCLPPTVDFMIGSEIKDDMKHDMKDKKKKKKRRRGEEDDEDDTARVSPSTSTRPVSFVNYDPRFNHRMVLTQAMWQRVR
ncbi:MAG: hypothetical protein FJ271_15645 [Planctomycetes bacterium]|nr:hypothetical protein [Planctomycetota bacterium]